MGLTKAAVNFLSDARVFYVGDINKYNHLIETLSKQIEPSGKHHCKSLLFELPEPRKTPMEFVAEMFGNITRVKRVRVYENLDLDR